MRKNQLKDFSKFLEEVSIRGNEGIPGEGSDRRGNQYLSDTERAERARLGVPREEDPRFGMPRQTMETGRELMQLANQSMQMARGKEAELEALALDVIMNEYGSILDNVDLDIKLVRPGDVKDFMDQEKCEDCEMPSYQLLNDPEIKKEVDKRKIINNIMQGEAKNTKRILVMPEIRDRIVEIFGRQGDEIIRIWTRITDLAEKMDWLIPVDIKGEMMEEQPQGLAGACSVKWPEAEENEDLAEKVLKGMEEDGDIDPESEDLQELLSTGNPIIKARGIDFPMLLHETVKGIYELISAAGIPEEKRTAELVMLNTSSFEDEAEEFRYGPVISSNLRDFINSSDREIDKYPNIREHVYGLMVQLPADDFLKLMRGILSQSNEARTTIDSMIDEVIKTLDEYELGEALPSMRDDEGEENREEGDFAEPGEEADSDIESLIRKTSNKESTIDYSEMTQREIQELIDDALDRSDFDEVRKLSQYIKEGREIYLKEIERLNESHIYHNRRK